MTTSSIRRLLVRGPSVATLMRRSLGSRRCQHTAVDDHEDEMVKGIVYR
ncbi:hypothetical protein Hanom_Chr14g01286871 [Helianthus anomalus]